MLSGSDRVAKPMLINGDSLGQETSESFDTYVNRAAQSIDMARADGDYVGYGLVTFTQPQSAQSVGTVVENITRVNAIQVAGSPVVGIPEPVKSTRGDYIAHQLKIHDLPINEITGVVAYDRVSVLAMLIDAPEVAAVEVLPSDAAWNRFSVRPVHY